MSSYNYFANILLSHELPMGRNKVPCRKKGDWFHSISVFSENEFPIDDNGKQNNCTIIHFFSENGSPVLEKINSKICFVKTHKNKSIYKIDCWPNSWGVIGDIRTETSYINGCGKTPMFMDKILSNAFDKWSHNKIPYAHQRSESYNCVAFVDDILYFSSNGIWNKRIENNHIKYGLYL